MLLSQSGYQFIGLVNITSENVVIIDPYINNISVLSENISPAVSCSQRLSRVRCGTYNCYATLNTSGIIKSLLISHDSVDISAFKEKDFDFHGMVSVAFDRIVCICDEEHIYQTSSYGAGIPLYDDALFSVSYLRQQVRDEVLDCSEACRYRLEQLLCRCGNASYVSGKNIKREFGNEHLWSGFYTFNEFSTLWSCSIQHKIRESVSRTACGLGYVAAKSQSPLTDELRCFVIRSIKNKILGIKIEMI